MPYISRKRCSSQSLGGLKDNEYIWSHYPPSDEINMAIERGEVIAFFNYRDPRDVVTSRFNWQSPKNEKVTNTMREFMKKVYKHFPNDEAFLTSLIKGEKFVNSDFTIGEKFRLSRGFLFHPAVINIRFEDIVGEKGGGTDEKQLEMINLVINNLGIVDRDPILVAKKAFNTNAMTFNKGQIGRVSVLLTTPPLRA